MEKSRDQWVISKSVILDQSLFLDFPRFCYNSIVEISLEISHFGPNFVPNFFSQNEPKWAKIIHFGEISRSMSYLEISHFGPKFVPRFPTILSQFNCEKPLEISHFGNHSFWSKFVPSCLLRSILWTFWWKLKFWPSKLSFVEDYLEGPRMLI